jgi:hypothetical protein
MLRTMAQQLLGSFPLVSSTSPLVQGGALAATLVFTFVLSEVVLRAYVQWLKKNGESTTSQTQGSGSKTGADGVGFVIGKCENLIIFSLISLGQYEALGLVLAAKSIARMQDMKTNPSYYLAGTLLNFVCSMLGGILARALVLGFS